MKRNMKILVIGGSGFLGSHIADAFSAAGHEVTIYDLKTSQYLRSEQRMILGDVLDTGKLQQVIKGMDQVIHLAALADIDIAHNNPYETMKINVLGTTSVLEAARSAEVERVIFASTIYVNSRTGSFYRVSKHACELLLEAYHERYGLKYTILRFGTLYGTRANAHNSVYKHIREALLHGRIYFEGSGHEVREFIHVIDAARICVKIAQEDFAGETLILTGHQRLELREFLDMINEIMGGHIEITYDPNRSKSHYVQTPYSYIPRVGKKIVMDTYCDLGQSMVEMLNEIGAKQKEETITL